MKLNNNAVKYSVIFSNKVTTDLIRTIEIVTKSFIITTAVIFCLIYGHLFQFAGFTIQVALLNIVQDLKSIILLNLSHV